MYIKRLITTVVALTLVLNVAGQYTRKGSRPIDKSKTAAAENIGIKMEDLQGKWQEMERMDLKKNKLHFDDTLFLNIQGNLAILSQGASMSMKGPGAIEGKYLQLPTGDYELISKTANGLTVSDGETISTLVSVEQFYKETLGKDVVKTLTEFEPTDIKPADVLGDWNIYRRKSKPGNLPADFAMLKKVHIQNMQGDTALLGEVEYAVGNKGFKEKAVFGLVGTQLTIQTAQSQWILNTYKLENGEFIFGEETTIVYYGKK